MLLVQAWRLTACCFETLQNVFLLPNAALPSSIRTTTLNGIALADSLLRLLGVSSMRQGTFRGGSLMPTSAMNTNRMSAVGASSSDRTAGTKCPVSFIVFFLIGRTKNSWHRALC